MNMAKSSKNRAPAAILPIAVILSLLGPVGCSNKGEEPIQAELVLKSGDWQYSRHGSELARPLVVKVVAPGGSGLEGVEVDFSILQGTGSLSPARDRSDSEGLASTKLTLGPEKGTVTVKASLVADAGKMVLFHAISSDFFCPEADPAPTVSYGRRGNLYLATLRSGLYSSGSTNAGIVLLDLLNATVTGFTEIRTDQLISVIWDVAFSPRGDLYLARNEALAEVAKVATDGTVSHFASLEDPLGSELATFPSGLLVGCDRFGPFYVGCRDTLMRFPGAYYQGVVNNDALAVDPETGDLYFVSTQPAALLRLPLDSLVVQGPVETVAGLSPEEAAGANGMAVAPDGIVYLLVDADTTKEMLAVDPTGGTKTVAFDFSALRPNGVFRELAIDHRNFMLYTIDTEANDLLGYSLLTPSAGFVTVIPANDAISTPSDSGERIGLVVLP